MRELTLSARAVSMLTVLWMGRTMGGGWWEGLLLFRALVGAGLNTYSRHTMIHA